MPDGPIPTLGPIFSIFQTAMLHSYSARPHVQLPRVWYIAVTSLVPPHLASPSEPEAGPPSSQRWPPNRPSLWRSRRPWSARGPACKRVFREPVIDAKCGHTFCRGCTEELIRAALHIEELIREGGTRARWTGRSATRPNWSSTGPSSDRCVCACVCVGVYIRVCVRVRVSQCVYTTTTTTIATTTTTTTVRVQVCVLCVLTIILPLSSVPLKALRHGPPTQSDYVHFSVHNVVPRRLGTRPTVYVHAANLPARVKRSRRCLCSSSTASLHAQLPHLDVEPSTSL